MLPPSGLLVETPHPDFTGSSNGDLVNYIDELGNALDVCNADKASLRTWAAEPLTTSDEQ